MKQILSLLCFSLLLTACEKQITSPESNTLELESKKKDAEITLAVGSTTNALIQPIGNNPVRFAASTSVQLNDWDKLAKEAAKADFSKLRFELQVQLIRPQGDEVSMPEKDMLSLQLDKIDIKTGVLYFSAKELNFSLRYPEDQYEVKTAKLIIHYPAKKGNQQKGNDLKKIFQSSTNKALSDGIGVEEVIIIHEPLVRVKSGNPYRVDVFNPNNQTTTSFVMYANKSTDIQFLFNNSLQSGKAKISITPLKESTGFEILRCYFNINNNQLVGVGSNKWSVLTFEEKGIYSTLPDDGVQEQNGYGTRRSTTTVRSQPQLL